MVKELYPFKNNYLKLNNLKYHYVDEGSGDPIIMLHGNPTWSFYYRNLVLALKDSYRTIVPDHIGCGLSDKPDDDHYTYSLEQRVNDLVALLDNLKVNSNVTLVLHDWGGMIGMTYATRFPERVKRIIVLNSGTFHLPKGKRFPLALRLCRNSMLGALLVRGLNAFCLSATRVCTKRTMDESVRRAYLSPYDSWDNRIAIHRFVQDIPLRPNDRGYKVVTRVEEELFRLSKIPMLICWGEKDFVFDHHFLGEWIRRFPMVEVHRFPNAGHYVLEDANKEIIVLIKDFLKANPLSSLSGYKQDNNNWLEKSARVHREHRFA